MEYSCFWVNWASSAMVVFVSLGVFGVVAFMYIYFPSNKHNKIGLWFLFISLFFLIVCTPLCYTLSKLPC
jgi:hypothetical protein